MTKLPPPCLKHIILIKFSLKTHINYILLEMSCINLHVRYVAKNIRSKFTEIFPIFVENFKHYRKTQDTEAYMYIS